MNELAPLMQDQRKIDADQLQLLSIFHFIGAGLALLAILFLLVHFAIFHAVFDNPSFWPEPKQTPPFWALFAIFKVFYVFFGVWLLASSILNLLSALSLRSRGHRAFSLVVAGINCLHFPLGTALGVFTIIVLMRNSVRELYEV